jgi:Trk-type K+ transport system membrane component
MNLILFIVTIAISFLVVRIGAIAFQLTGLEWALAKFQSLSCFSGTGFTTREAELITGNPQRRKIATSLMILGNAGHASPLSPRWLRHV